MEILGIDSSENMVNKARVGHPDIKFLNCDALLLNGCYDLLFSNACLQWIANHDTLISFLMKHLDSDSVLAVQILMNEDETLFILIKGIAPETKWGMKDIPLQPNETLIPAEYCNILAGCSSSFDIWEIKYYHSEKQGIALVGKKDSIRKWILALLNTILKLLKNIRWNKI